MENFRVARSEFECILEKKEVLEEKLGWTKLLCYDAVHFILRVVDRQKMSRGAGRRVRITIL